MKTKIFKNRTKIKMRGFSLIELLISITLFTFVTLVAVACIVASQQLNSRLKATRILYDNMYFTMEELGRELRQGNSYSNDTSCAPASSCIIFTPYQAYSAVFYKVKYAKSSTGGIEKFKETAPSSNIFNTTGIMTNENINIKDLKFEIIGADTFSSGDRSQPGVKIIIKGETKDKAPLSFQLDNFVSQRDSDN